ncbi:DapH/DapD/GlmU-related protein [Formosa algae]|uniref:Acetyltransferase-like isoleucine patch superfamily enzyme n=1 Tax=Formosa algae TaxID=225843 RepID=A0A9X0YI76_9FLAO|nr:DapH/DapD/GlmU-related protein [Formosa algae]MBP1839122.1 acetyltransferase-like isoleucine patch superfamily enzyme [Formosa algae]MDQ0333899.1 acetyltransferase-like isoleucine patch superfamily enzyme [Formosa algae]
MNTAPIILFVYNRPDHAFKTLQALSKNELANESTLIIYADGPNKDATLEEQNLIKETRAVLKKEQWCKNVTIIESQLNKGLAESIINGVTETVEKYGKVIVLEDDIVTSSGFLKFMNNALDFYKDNNKVMHVSGFMYPHKDVLPETFCFNVPLCWGWATWDRAWKYFEKDTDVLLDYAIKDDNWNLINKFGGDVLGAQLKLNKLGKIKTWFIKWHVSVLMQNGYTVYPGVSLVENIGFDNSGENNPTTTKFKQNSLSDSVSVKQIPLEENLKAEKIIIDFYKNLWKPNKTKKEHSKFKARVKNKIKVILRKTILIIFPELLNNKSHRPSSKNMNTYFGNHTKLDEPYNLLNVLVGNYTYLSKNCHINNTVIGKFCSIGPNLISGWGMHPTNGISTHPMFYSINKQNGMTLSATNKFKEMESIKIGNDVFIGANVIILNGVDIGDGAVIGAGSVVSKNIPPYAIAVGAPIKILKYRFSEDKIKSLLALKWWDYNESELQDVEKYFFDVEKLINKSKL